MASKKKLESEKVYDFLCVELLRKFTARELEELTYFVNCQYFNWDKYVIKLLKNIQLHVLNKNNFTQKVYCNVYEKVFSEKVVGEDLDGVQKKRFNNKLNLLLSLVKQFLTIEALNENKAYSSDLLLQKILEKRQYNLFNRHINKDKKNLDAQPYKDFAYHQQQQFVEENRLNYLHRSGELLNKDNLNELMYQTDIQYFLKKLSLLTTVLSLQNITSRRYDTTSIDLMLSMLDSPQYSSHPLIQIYRATIDLMRQASEKNYRQLLTTLDDNETAIPKSDLNGFYVAATNFCAQQILEGKFGYQELFDLYRIMDEKDLLIEEDFIPVGKFKNTITAGCRVGEFEWASTLTEKYKDAVKEPIRESVYHFNMGAIAFYQDDYKTALHHLVRVDSINLTYDNDCRVMLVKSYYETDQEYDERTLQIFRSTEKYFNENQQLTLRNKNAYKNFIRSLINIYRVRHRATKMTLENIKKKLEGQEVNSDKKWLMEKIAELG